MQGGGQASARRAVQGGEGKGGSRVRRVHHALPRMPLLMHAHHTDAWQPPRRTFSEGHLMRGWRMRWWKSEVVALFCGRRRRAGRQAGRHSEHGSRVWLAVQQCRRGGWHTGKHRLAEGHGAQGPEATGRQNKLAVHAAAQGAARRGRPACQPMMKKCGKRNWPRNLHRGGQKCIVQRAMSALNAYCQR